VTQPTWQTARVVSTGKTNVRADPRINSAIVAHLDPGAVILVQRASGEWWRARPSRGAAFEGYIRRDRLVFK
jgi:SH3-like domain-containing protein